MINLLPLKEKRELLLKKNEHLAIVLGSMLIVFLICLALILLFLKFYMLQKAVYQKELLQEAKEKYQTDEFSSLLESLKRYNTNLLKINSFYKKDVHLSDTLTSILQIEMPLGISFDSIALDQSDSENKTKVSIYGTSSSRDNLLSFRDNISKKDNVKNIYLPPDSLVKQFNVSFYITFDMYLPK